MFKIRLGIEGMACNMCESHINDVIRRSFPVKKVSSSHLKGETVIISQTELTESSVRDSILSIGYSVTSYNIEPYEKRSIFHRG